MRVTLLTDTLGDINGVSRFIQNIAAQARATGRDLEVLTSTRLPIPQASNLINFRPLFATSMPGYKNLELAIPPAPQILRHLARRPPDVLHVSTPGPVGMVGFLAAKLRRIPILGVYHTDFPAYIDHLFDDAVFTEMARGFMRFFYRPFTAIFTRSEDYVESLVRLGLPRARMLSLVPGIDTDAFHPRFRDQTLWDTIPGVDPLSVKVLYVGRVSVEKNLPFLASVWPRVRSQCSSRGLRAELIVVGDGPYRVTMQSALAGQGAHFLGFRHGRELAALYASSDLFVFPSTTDTLGQVVMESQASGLPVLVTDRGGPKEVVQQGRTGHILSATDEPLWARTITDLIASTDRRRHMGARAHAAMQRYSMRDSFDHFWQVHSEACDAHRAGLSAPFVTDQAQHSGKMQPSP
jgi:glycosyltransferase involved in cell wall biosynthesis